MYALFSWYKILEVFVIANKEKDLFINEQIRAKEVMVIGPNGEQLGIKSIKDAITLSTYAGFDLVLINPNANPPSIARILAMLSKSVDHLIGT